MEKIFILDSCCYLRQYADIGCKVSGIKSLKITKIFEKKIKILVTFDLNGDATATRCCFYLSRCTPPTPSTRWIEFGDITLPNGTEASLFAGLIEY